MEEAGRSFGDLGPISTSSTQVDDEEGANVLNVTIWVEGSVLEYELRCVPKKTRKISATYQHAGGAPG